MREEAEITILKQLIHSLEEATLKMEKAYNEKDYDNFYKAKKMILQLQKRILEEIK